LRFAGFFKLARKEADNEKDRSELAGARIPRKLLGELETEIMEYMWAIEEARVQHIYRLINQRRPIAYTTVMTVMGHLTEKGLLTRSSEGNRYVYQIAMTRTEFLRNASKNQVRSILNDFGDLAIAGFLGEITRLKPEKLDQLKALLEEAADENGTTE
jgi:predicted transcriptional regulator